MSSRYARAIAPARTAPGVRFLPDDDDALLAHKDRSRIVPPLEWPSLGDNVTMATFLVDGFVAGVWKVVGTGGTAGIELRPLTVVRARERRDVETEAAALLGMLAPEAGPGAVRWLGGG